MGDLFSAISGSSKKAAKKQVQAADRANLTINTAKDQNIGSLQPIADTGIGGLNKLAMYLGLPATTGTADSTNPLYGSLLKPFTGQDLENTPGYQFGLKQGQQGLDHVASAAGNFLSGANLKAASQYNQDYAGTKFQEGYNRDALDKSRINDFLGSVANLGVNTTNNIANIRTGAATQVAGNQIGQGNAQAAGIIGQANAWGNVIDSGIGLAATGAMLGAGGIPGMGAAAGGASSAGGATSGLPGFSNNMLNPNFASNYMGLG